MTKAEVAISLPKYIGCMISSMLFLVVVVVLNGPYFPCSAESSHEDEESSSCAGATAGGTDTGGTDTGCTGTGSGTLSSVQQVCHEKKKRPYVP